MYHKNVPKWIAKLATKPEKKADAFRHQAPATPKEQVLEQFRSTTATTTVNQPVKSVKDVLKEIVNV